MYTNAYAWKTIRATATPGRHARINAWHNIDVQELKKFFGLLILTGTVLSPGVLSIPFVMFQNQKSHIGTMSPANLQKRKEENSYTHLYTHHVTC